MKIQQHELQRKKSLNFSWSVSEKHIFTLYAKGGCCTWTAMIKTMGIQTVIDTQCLKVATTHGTVDGSVVVVLSVK